MDHSVTLQMGCSPFNEENSQRKWTVIRKGATHVSSGSTSGKGQQQSPEGFCAADKTLISWVENSELLTDAFPWVGVGDFWVRSKLLFLPLTG